MPSVVNMNQRTVEPDFITNASGTDPPAPHCGQTEASLFTCPPQCGQATKAIGIPRFPVCEPANAGNDGPKLAQTSLFKVVRAARVLL